MSAISKWIEYAEKEKSGCEERGNTGDAWMIGQMINKAKDLAASEQKQSVGGCALHSRMAGLLVAETWTGKDGRKQEISHSWKKAIAEALSYPCPRLPATKPEECGLRKEAKKMFCHEVCKGPTCGLDCDELKKMLSDSPCPASQRIEAAEESMRNIIRNDGIIRKANEKLDKEVSDLKAKLEAAETHIKRGCNACISHYESTVVAAESRYKEAEGKLEGLVKDITKWKFGYIDWGMLDLILAKYHGKTGKGE